MLTRLFRTESFRLTAIFAALILGAMLGLMALVYTISHQAFYDQLQNAILHDLDSVEAGYRSEGVSEAKEVVHQRLFGTHGNDYLLLETTSQVKLAGNLPAMPPVSGEHHIPVPHPLTGEDRGDHEIVGQGRLLSSSLYVFAGRDLYVGISAEESMLHAFAWVLAATLVVALAGGILLSNGFLGRMDAITRTCRAIMAGDLSNRIPERGTRDEFDQLVHTLNAMLDRISALMENVQQISSDIAHDLRTPLTRLRHRLESAHSDDSTIEDYRQAVEQAIAESETMLATFSALLRIGQIESGAAGITLVPVDLSRLLVEIADIYRPATEDSGHSLTVDIQPGVVVSGDKTMLTQVFANLIENAMTHSPPSGSIEVLLAETAGSAIASVSDRGSGIPAAEHERVFRRFYRLERSRSTPGSGLGLSLVAAILKYHGAEIALSDNNPGLRAEMTFETSPPDPRDQLSS
ncbi:MAG: HAMP domain-containing protein [Alphaproteobacteria bacterium]|nr:HAMP domain-containing protein [Alphaproteobacteria bacterium]